MHAELHVLINNRTKGHTAISILPGQIIFILEQRAFFVGSIMLIISLIRII